MAAESLLFSAVIFDFDGTLSDTPLDFGVMRDNAWQAVLRVMYDLGVEPFFPPERTIPLMEELEKLFATLPPEVVVPVREAAYASIHRTEVEAGEKAILFPCVREALAAGREKGVRFGIVTRNCKAAVLAAFPDVESFIPHILTRHDVPYPKPHPDHLCRALASMHCKASEALMVGDHRMDIEVGKRAGTATAAVSTGQMPYESLAEQQPDFLEKNFCDLMRRIRIL